MDIHIILSVYYLDDKTHDPATLSKVFPSVVRVRFLEPRISIFFSANRFQRTFLSISAHQAVLLWGLSDTCHKLWMASWWPRCSRGAGSKTCRGACSFTVQTHAALNLTKLQSWSTPGSVTCDLIAMESCKQGLLCEVAVLTFTQTQTGMQITQHLLCTCCCCCTHISARGVTRTACLISVRCLVITQIKGQGTA